LLGSLYWARRISLTGHLLSISKIPKDIRRILVVRTDRLGDVVLTLPVLPPLRKCFPDAHIAMLLKHYTGEIVEGNPYINECLWYDNGSTLIPFPAMCRTLRERRFDVAIVVYPRPRLAALMACSGIPVRIGTGYRYYSLLFNRRVYEHRSKAERHEVEYNLNLIKVLGCKSAAVPEFLVAIEETTREKVQRLLDSIGIGTGKRLVVIHPGSGGSAREWPATSFGLLAAKIVEHGDTSVVVTGSRGEERKVAEVVVASDGLAIPLVGVLALKELAALLEVCSLFVSNSTGPIHIAAAVGAPVIGMYPQHTAMSARRWGPVSQRKKIFVPKKPADCRDCTRFTGEPCLCMMSISVDEVCRAAVAMLDEARKEVVEEGHE